MDVSHLIVVATANDLRDMPPSLVDRFLVVTVGTPEGSDIAMLIQVVSGDIAARFNVFDARLASSALALLVGLPPRRLRTVLTLAWAKALATSQSMPGEAEIRQAIRLAGGGRTPIGFATDRRAPPAVTRSQF